MNNPVVNLEVETVRPRKYIWQRHNEDMDGPHGRPRVYIEWPDYSVMENLENRYNRPYQLVKKPLEKLLRDSGMDFDKIRWSQHAGCTMCGCSPGFILEGTKLIGFDMWVKMEVA